MPETKKAQRRFAIEEIDNGYLVKVTEAGNDKFVGRWAFQNGAQMLVWLGGNLDVK